MKKHRLAVFLSLTLLVAVAFRACFGPTSTPIMDHVVQLPTGTGTVVSEGWVLTAKHVANSLPDDVEHVDHPVLDVSLVKWDTSGKSAVEVASQSPGVGFRVLLVGIAAGRTEVVSGGFTGSFHEYPNWGSLTAEGAPGMSGGAVLRHGRLVGIYLGSFLVWGSQGWMIDSSPEQRYLRVEAFSGWLDSLLF
jgi:hypothetical protein